MYNMEVKGLLTILLLGFIGTVSTSHFRGGYITWAPDPNEPSQIIVTWRLSWRGSTTNCTKYSRNLIGDSDNIYCDLQCTPSGTNAKVICTDTNVQEDWSSGVNTAHFNLNSSRATIRYTGGDWIHLITNMHGSNWELAAHVDLKKRPDNNKINTSPKTTQKPVLYTQQGCPITINIPVADIDRDVIRCRWADEESGGITRPPTDVLTNLDEANCRLTVVHNSDAFIAIALAIEDFIPPYKSSSQPLSKVPIQFLVKVDHVDPPLPCDMYGQRPVFVQPTPEDNAVYDVLSGTAINITLRARAVDPTLPITQFSTISPQGLTKSNLIDGSNDEMFIIIWWTPTANQDDTELFCFSADDSRQSSELRCVSFNAVADDEPPIIFGGPTSVDMSVGTNSSTATVFWTLPTTSDNTGEAVTLTSNYVPGDMFFIGTTRVMYRAVDVNGNIATYSFNVTVNEEEPADVVIYGTSSRNISADTNSATALRNPPLTSVVAILILYSLCIDQFQ